MGNFGVPDGLARRLAYWSRQLRCNKEYPWVGTGLIDDLECAARQLEPGFEPPVYAPESVAAQPLEYDL